MRASISIGAFLVVFVAACGAGGPGEVEPVTEATSEKLVIFTVNYPLAHFSERIGGDLVEVVFPAPADEDPAFWSPNAETIAAYQGADLILLNGAGYAKWVDRATLPTSKIVDTSAAFADRLVPLAGTTTHSHGPEGEHEHGGYAFTTWLDPVLAARQARAVADSLSSLRPDKTDDIQSRLGLLEADILGLDQHLEAAAGAIGETPLLFSHPVYQYLIRRFELNGLEVHWEPDEAPDGEAWDHLEELLESHPAKWMLWEGEPLEATVAGLNELGVSSVVFDPCGNRPEAGDYLSVMETNADALEAIAQ